MSDKKNWINYIWRKNENQKSLYFLYIYTDEPKQSKKQKWKENPQVWIWISFKEKDHCEQEGGTTVSNQNNWLFVF